MLSELLSFAALGFQHIVALDAFDHVLFLLVLAAIYRGRDWRQVLWVISAFTVGHSITLALAVTNVLVLPSRLVEFLIPLTIIATGIENIIQRTHASQSVFSTRRVLFAAAFGLVHGAGFAGYLRSLFLDSIAVPLLGFNLGIEAGQIVVLAATAVLFRLVDRGLSIAVPSRDPFPLRLCVVSLTVTLIATEWAWQRFPR
ncbi:HupE/UreJ family protein [Gemmatimonas sp.]|uniref:HupE/UreJ family protein n=1 Tax=Gemmatimonas sp. TaxID=1962908 RepID=UPI00356849B4